MQTSAAAADDASQVRKRDDDHRQASLRAARLRRDGWRLGMANVTVWLPLCWVALLVVLGNTFHGRGEMWALYALPVLGVGYIALLVGLLRAEHAAWNVLRDDDARAFLPQLDEALRRCAALRFRLATRQTWDDEAERLVLRAELDAYDTLLLDAVSSYGSHPICRVHGACDVLLARFAVIEVQVDIWGRDDETPETLVPD